MHEENETHEDVSLRDYLDVLRRRRAIVLQTFLALLIVGTIVALFSPKVFHAEGELLVKTDNHSLAAMDNPLSDLVNNSSTRNVETQMQVLTSGPLLKQALRACRLNKDDIKIKVDTPASDKDVDIILVTVDTNSPQHAADFINTLMKLYIARDTTERNKDLYRAINYAQADLDKTYSAWKNKALDFQRNQNKTHIIDWQMQLDVLTRELAELESKENESEASLNGMNAQMTQISTNLNRLPKEMRSTQRITNPDLASLDSKINDLKAQRRAKIALFKPENTAVKIVDEQIAALQKQRTEAPPTILSESITENPEVQDTQQALRKLEANRKDMIASLTSTLKQKGNVVGKIEQLGKTEFTQTKLSQELEIAQDHYKDIAKQLTDLQLRAQAQSSPYTILEPAEPDRKPTWPNPKLIIPLSAITGLLLGACIALLQEFLDDRVNSPEDARRLMGVPVLGYIPSIPSDEEKLLTSATSTGPILESCRILRSNVRFAAVGEPLQTIMVTSTTPGEGKSMIAYNLAVAMAMDGKQIILVDCDLRRPTVHEKVGLRNTPGLTNVLVGTMSVDRALQQSPIENLRILTSGPLPPNPAELLNSRAMEQAQEELKERADVVIFDSPPCLTIADAQVLAANVDGLIYVVQLHSTKKSALRHGHELLRQAHARILGVVYNKVVASGSKNDYYHYGYYTYSKGDLAGKGGYGHRTDRNIEEWEALTAQAKAAITAVASPVRTPQKNNGNGAETHASGESKE